MATINGSFSFLRVTLYTPLLSIYIAVNLLHN